MLRAGISGHLTREEEQEPADFCGITCSSLASGTLALARLFALDVNHCLGLSGGKSWVCQDEVTAKTSHVQGLSFCVPKLGLELGSTCTMSEIRNQTSLEQQQQQHTYPFSHSLANVQFFFPAPKARLPSQRGELKDVNWNASQAYDFTSWDNVCWSWMKSEGNYTANFVAVISFR